jgi:hypothetical protein
MLLRGWTAFLWLASGMCLAPHKPHHPQEKGTLLVQVGGGLDAVSTHPLHPGTGVPAKNRPSGIHIL